MRLRLPFLCLCFVLVGLAAASFRLRPSSLPVGDEATHILMARSLVADRDLSFDERDLREGYRIWNGGPAGVALLTRDGGRSLRFAEPVAWALAAAPVYALLGPSGLLVLNMVLFLAMLAAAATLFRDQGGLVNLFLAGFFFASATFGYVFRGSPEVFLMACLFFGLLLWKRTARTAGTARTKELGALAVAGALFGAAALQEPVLALFGIAVAADLALARRWKGAAALVLAGILVFGVLAMGQRKLTGAWSPANPREGIQRRSFETEFPVESQQDLWQAYGKSRPAPDLAAGLRLLPRNLGYFLAGRNTGLLAYFPFALLALGLTARSRSRWLLLSAAGAAVLLGLLLDPHRWHGGPGALGNACFAAIYPVLLFLPGRLTVRWRLLLPFAAAALWTLPALAPALSAASAGLPAFRALPLELTLLGDGGQLAGYRVRGWDETVWVLPLATSWPEEDHPNGVWLKGASASEIVVVSPRPLDRVRFNVYSLSADSELFVESGADRVLVRFDSEGKRNGAPVDLAVKEAASGLGILPGTAGEHAYRFTLNVSDGIIPARHLPGNQDPRYLGVFLDVTGKGL
jgi:hypothetical protein